MSGCQSPIRSEVVRATLSEYLSAEPGQVHLILNGVATIARSVNHLDKYQTQGHFYPDSRSVLVDWNGLRSKPAIGPRCTVDSEVKKVLIARKSLESG